MEAQPPASDSDLMRRVAEGDEDAFGALYDRYAEVVFGAAIRFLGDRQLAEDVVQDTYLALWNRADRFDQAAGSLLGWLSAIARNRAIDRLRAAGRRPATVSLSAAAQAGESEADALERVVAEGIPVASAHVDGDPESALLRSWAGALVQSALREMPDLERRPIELAYHDGLTQREIADRLGWPLGTVKTRTRRGLERLRSALAPLTEPDLPVPPEGARSTDGVEPTEVSALGVTGE
jgi:RNA polymerase sigma-70 factor, ECF subfamily